MASEAIFQPRICLRDAGGLHKTLDRTAAEAESNPRNPFTLVSVVPQKPGRLRPQTSAADPALRVVTNKQRIFGGAST
jgi:hypothetical protein